LLGIRVEPVEDEPNIEEGELKGAMGNTTPILDAPVTFIPDFLVPEIADTTLTALLACTMPAFSFL